MHVVVDDCIAKGVRAIVVITAGFAETGGPGRQLEAELLAAVRRAGIRMIGPNCMGLLNTDPAIQLNATFSPVFPPPGRVAMLSQSGALGLAILDHARHLHIGLSTFVSVGNKADVSGNDLLQYWEQDPQTDVILMYLESFGNPRKFSQIARRLGRRKPIVAVKAGRSRSGARAATSHTGALATSDAVVDALFRQCGVIRTDTMEELFDVTSVLSQQPVPRGPSRRHSHQCRRAGDPGRRRVRGQRSRRRRLVGRDAARAARSASARRVGQQPGGHDRLGDAGALRAGGGRGTARRECRQRAGHLHPADGHERAKTSPAQ